MSQGAIYGHCTETQFGGRPGLGTTMANHAVHLFMQWAKHQRLSAGVIWDICAAFYEVVRELCMDLSCADEDIAFLLKSLNNLLFE